MAQWLRICLPMQGTRVRALVWEDPTCRGAPRPVSHNYWACASGACAPQQERPRQWEARTPRWRVSPARCNWRKPSHRNEDPTQPKINKLIKLKKKNSRMFVFREYFLPTPLPISPCIWPSPALAFKSGWSEDSNSLSFLANWMHILQSTNL